MAGRQLPSRFPVGTRYVIEGHRGEEGELCVVSRKIIMPNGKSFDLKDGVKIGKVTGIGLKDNRARVAMRINQGVEIDDPPPVYFPELNGTQPKADPHTR